MLCNKEKVMAQRTLGIVINCDDKTCASEPGSFCAFYGTRKFGTTPCCTLFPEGQSFTELKEDRPFGWIQRCPACIDAEKIRQ